MYIDQLDDIVNKYNNTYHRTIKMKSVDLKLSMYNDFNKENNEEGPKFKVGDNVRISKYINTFAKGYVSNWSEEVFVVKKVKNTVPWTYVISDLNGEEFLQKRVAKNKSKRVEKVIKRKGNKLYVRWKGYDNSFNNSIDKYDIV